MKKTCCKYCKYQTSATQVRLKGYGDKGSQESSFQNRRGTQEMMSAERRLSRFLFVGSLYVMIRYYRTFSISISLLFQCTFSHFVLVSSGERRNREKTRGSCSTAAATKEQEEKNVQEGTQTARGDSQLYLKVLPVTREDIEYMCS